MNSFEDTQKDVLIVGAGPTGLTLAMILARSGVGVRIIDKNQSRSDKSKALGVHAGTLELFGAFFGNDLPTQMIECGHRVYEDFFHFEGKPPLRADASLIPSKYNFVLILEQSQTERILEEKLQSLGISVERGTELINFSVNRDSIVSRVQGHSSGKELKSRYLIGCDGAHSRVRAGAQIQFKGSQFPGNCLLADVQLDWPWEHGTIRTFISSKGAAGFFPYKTEGHYRVVIVPRDDQTLVESSDALELSEMQNWVRQVVGNEIQLKTASWTSRFKVNQRIADTYRKENIFLAGDAAHIHSPVGGQGMNVGIQDAVNLGNKLTLVIKGDAPEKILDHYEKERRPVAKKVVFSTGFIFRLAVLPENLLIKFMNRFLLPYLVKNKWAQRKMASAISEVTPARREIKLSNHLLKNLSAR